MRTLQGERVKCQGSSRLLIFRADTQRHKSIFNNSTAPTSNTDSTLFAWHWVDASSYLPYYMKEIPNSAAQIDFIKIKSKELVVCLPSFLLQIQLISLISRNENASTRTLLKMQKTAIFPNESLQKSFTLKCSEGRKEKVSIKQSFCCLLKGFVLDHFRGSKTPMRH